MGVFIKGPVDPRVATVFLVVFGAIAIAMLMLILFPGQ
jgi:hypothetical protein